MQICLIGEVYVEVLQLPRGEVVRLGGVIHAARALWAIGKEYRLAYVAPQYLSQEVDQFARRHGAVAVERIGEVKGAPNVVLVRRPTEVTSQGYEFLLSDKYRSDFSMNKLRRFLTDEVSDVLLLPGFFKLEPVLQACRPFRVRFHIDIANEIEDVGQIAKLDSRFDTVIISTSSYLFLERYGASVNKLRDAVIPRYSKALLFKENRGGARFFLDKTEQVVRSGAQTRPVIHSVGVGDCFDAVFIQLCHIFDTEAALTYASWIAAEYASTLDMQIFKQRCSDIIDIGAESIIRLAGTRVPWEGRGTFHIYIAAPDFAHVDTKPIDHIVESLFYHNFVPRLPVREHGEVGPETDADQRKQVFSADMVLLSECQLLIAVLISNDPGTLIEVGIAAGLGKPVIVYDPFRIANNLVLIELPELVSNSLDEILVKVFEIASTKITYDKSNS